MAEKKKAKKTPWYQRFAITAVLVAGGIAAGALGQPIVGAALISAAVGREVGVVNGRNGSGK